MAFRNGHGELPNRHSPKSPANRVRKREASSRLPYQPPERFALQSASYTVFHTTPSKLITILSTTGRLGTFASPQAVASVTPPWGPGRKSLGDGDAAAGTGRGQKWHVKQSPKPLFPACFGQWYSSKSAQNLIFLCIDTRKHAVSLLRRGLQLW